MRDGKIVDLNKKESKNELEIENKLFNENFGSLKLSKYRSQDDLSVIGDEESNEILKNNQIIGKYIVQNEKVGEVKTE